MSKYIRDKMNLDINELHRLEMVVEKIDISMEVLRENRLKLHNKIQYYIYSNTSNDRISGDALFSYKEICKRYLEEKANRDKAYLAVLEQIYKIEILELELEFTKLSESYRTESIASSSSLTFPHASAPAVASMYEKEQNPNVYKTISFIDESFVDESFVIEEEVYHPDDEEKSFREEYEKLITILKSSSISDEKIFEQFYCKKEFIINQYKEIAKKSVYKNDALKKIVEIENMHTAVLGLAYGGL